SLRTRKDRRVTDEIMTAFLAFLFQHKGRKELSKRFLERWTLRREKPGPVLSNVQAILQANSKFPINYEGGFIAETHPGLNRGLVSAHEVCPFMAVESDS